MSSRRRAVNEVEYVVGQELVYVARWFSDADGETPADPTTITFRVQLPTDSGDDADFVYGTDSEVTRVSTGVYEFRYASAVPGVVWFRAEAAGAVVDAMEWSVKYRRSRFDDVPGVGS